MTKIAIINPRIPPTGEIGIKAVAAALPYVTPPHRIEKQTQMSCSIPAPTHTGLRSHREKYDDL